MTDSTLRRDLLRRSARPSPLLVAVATALLGLVAALPAQDLLSIDLEGGRELRYRVTGDRAHPAPRLIVDLRAVAEGSELAAAGVLVARPLPEDDRAADWIATDAPAAGAFLLGLRLRHRMAGLRVELVADAARARDALVWASRWPHDVAAVELRLDRAPPLPGLEALRWSPRLRVRLRPAAPNLPGLEDLEARLRGLGLATEEAPPVSRTAAEVAAREALDDFHHAAAVADEATYFGLFDDEGVFLGTDATERWTAAELREWSRPWFERDSAWIFVPQRRALTIGPGGRTAWFDEELGSRTYGACRGTGALTLDAEGRWRVALYDLTVPVPNALMKDVVAAIRAFEEGRPTAATTVVVVRHAEVESRPGDRDPPLSEAGRDRAEALARLLGPAGLDAVYSSEARRTRETAAPAARSAGCEVEALPALEVAGLVAKILGEHAGGRVLVVGHSNTVPAILGALGAPERVEIAHDQHGRVFVATLRPGATRVLELALP